MNIYALTAGSRRNLFCSCCLRLKQLTLKWLDSFCNAAPDKSHWYHFSLQLEAVMGLASHNENKTAAIVCFLASQGGDMNYCNHYGQTPLEMCPSEDLKRLMLAHCPSNE